MRYDQVVGGLKCDAMLCLGRGFFQAFRWPSVDEAHVRDSGPLATTTAPGQDERAVAM